jgi:hypothetical protein
MHGPRLFGCKLRARSSEALLWELPTMVSVDRGCFRGGVSQSEQVLLQRTLLMAH